MIVRRTNQSNRRLRASREHNNQHLLEVKMRRDPSRHHRAQKLKGFFLKIVFLLVLFIASFFGGKALLEKLLFKNPDYNVKYLEASLDGVITMEELKNLTSLREGVNIFQLDLGTAEKALNGLPAVRKAHVERILPNTIHVSIERRIPIFRLVSSPEEVFVPGESFVMDQDGVIMSPEKMDPSFLELPLLEGIDMSKISAGKVLEEDKLTFVLALWKSLTASNEIQELFCLHSIDLSKGYCAIVTDEANAHFIFSEENLSEELERLHKLLIHCQESGRQIETANLVLEHNTPVTFRLNSEAKVTQNKAPRSH